MDKNTKCGYSFSMLDRKDNFGNLSGFAEIFTFSSAHMVSVLVEIACYATLSLI